MYNLLLIQPRPERACTYVQCTLYSFARYILCANNYFITRIYDHIIIENREQCIFYLKNFLNFIEDERCHSNIYLL